MKLVILRGLPGSGKSTYARELVTTAGYKRVNKDDLRDMVDNGIWSADNEELINRLSYVLVQELLEQKQPVVVDNTHGAERHVRRLTMMGELAGYTVEVKVFNTPIETCIRNDYYRHSSQQVGAAVILRMAESTTFFKELYKDVQLDDIRKALASRQSEYRGPIRGPRYDRGEG